MKDKSLAVSKRDRQLLSILIAFVILFLLYFFLASPALDRGMLLVEQRQTAENELIAANDLVAQGPNLNREVEAKKAELSTKYAAFLYSINESRLLHQLDAFMTANGFAIDNYTQSEHIVSKLVLPVSAYTPAMYPLLELAKELNPLAVKEVRLSEVEPSSEGSVDSVEQIDIGIEFSAVAYESVYNFLKSVEGMNRTFIISDLQLENDPAEPGLNGLLVIRAVSLPKLDQEEAKDLEFTPTLPQGKANPF